MIDNPRPGQHLVYYNPFQIVPDGQCKEPFEVVIGKGRDDLDWGALHWVMVHRPGESGFPAKREHLYTLAEGLQLALRLAAGEEVP